MIIDTRTIIAAASLDALCEALSDARDAIAAHNADAAEFVRLEDLVDLCALPVYGRPVEDTSDGVWSWDDARVLYYDASKGWHLDARPDLDD